MAMGLSEGTMMQTLEVRREVEINAPIDVVFATVLEQLGPLNEAPDGTQLAMVLEARPGGRWFRDFGEKGGHLWGHVQSIRPYELLELHGPMFMSSPAISHVQYRLMEEGGRTRIRFLHQAAGLIPEEIQDGVAVNKGWTHHFDRVKASAERGRSGR